MVTFVTTIEITFLKTVELIIMTPLTTDDMDNWCHWRWVREILVAVNFYLLLWTGWAQPCECWRLCLAKRASLGSPPTNPTICTLCKKNSIQPLPGIYGGEGRPIHIQPNQPTNQPTGQQSTRVGRVASSNPRFPTSVLFWKRSQSSLTSSSPQRSRYKSYPMILLVVIWYPACSIKSMIIIYLFVVESVAQSQVTIHSYIKAN